MIAQNGPGITNFVTPVKTAYWNHTPLLLVTPQALRAHPKKIGCEIHGEICQAANKTIGQGGFQEVEQMAMFKDSVCYQEEAPRGHFRRLRRCTFVFFLFFSDAWNRQKYKLRDVSGGS